MFHRSIVLLILVAFPIVADAQNRGRSHQSRARSARAEALARPDGLAEALLPAGARRTPTVRFDTPHDDWRRWPQTGRGWWRQQRFGRQPFGTFYAVPYTGFSQYAPGGETEPPAAEYTPPATMTKGLVRVELTPAVAGLEYYVDGMLIGSSSNLGTEFELNAGARQIEIRARGYKSIVFDARIEIGRVTTLRGTLEAIEQAQPPRSTGSRIMYVIPGCYIGNSRPQPGALPPGCDVNKMVTRGNGL
jgi:hypothetical protein